jgi:polysaccharide export outer membrane protein
LREPSRADVTTELWVNIDDRIETLGEEKMKPLLRIVLPLLLTIAVASAPAFGANAAYLIHPGDQLAVSVYGETALTQTVTVLPDGSVDLPLAGSVHVAGVTADTASRLLAHSLAQYIRKPLVSISVVNQGQINALVLGDVKTPGKYALRSSARLSDGIAAAGGLDSTVAAELPVARVESGDAPVRVVSLQALLRDGDVSQDVALSDNSVIYVQSRATFDIEVVGAVDHPGEVEMHAGDRLSIAIAKAGNSATAQSDLSHVFVTRNDPTGKGVTTEIDMYRALEHGDLAGDPKLQKGDVVFIPQSKKPGTSGSTFFNFIRMILGF